MGQYIWAAPILLCFLRNRVEGPLPDLECFYWRSWEAEGTSNGSSCIGVHPPDVLGCSSLPVSYVAYGWKELGGPNIWRATSAHLSRKEIQWTCGRNESLKNLLPQISTWPLPLQLFLNYAGLACVKMWIISPIWLTAIQTLKEFSTWTLAEPLFGNHSFCSTTSLKRVCVFNGLPRVPTLGF